MHFPYGFIRLTGGSDGDSVDCYIGPNKNSRRVFVVHQQVPETGIYDEDKCMLGFNSPQDAKFGYLIHYDDPKFFQSMDEWDIDDFADHIRKKDSRGKMIEGREKDRWI